MIYSQKRKLVKKRVNLFEWCFFGVEKFLIRRCYFVMLLEETFNAFYSVLNFSSFIKKLFNITIKGHFFAMLVRKG